MASSQVASAGTLSFGTGDGVVKEAERQKVVSWRYLSYDETVMESPRSAPTEDLKKHSNVLGSKHAGNTGVLSFEPGLGGLVA